MRARRWGRRLCLGGAAALGASALLGPALARADDLAGRPAIYAALAGAAGIHQEANSRGNIGPTSEPVYGSIPDGLAVLSSGELKARASTFYPGGTVAGLGGFLASQACGAGFVPACMPVPAYPLSVQTTGSPPDAHADTGQSLGGGGAPVSLVALRADAHADPSNVSTDAADAGYDFAGATTSSVAAASVGFRRQAASILAGPAAAAAVHQTAADGSATHADSILASTRQGFRGASTVVTDSNAVLQGVRLLGDVVHIDSIVAASHSETDGRGADKHNDQVTLSGVTVAGQPATIDQNGITIGGSQSGSAPLDALNTTLHQALDAAGAQVRLIGVTANPPHPVAPGCGKTEAEGVLLHLQADVSPVPFGDVYYADLVLGGACSTASAGADRLGGTSADLGVGGAGAALAPAGGAGTSPSGSGSLTGAAPGLESGALAASPSGAGAAGAASLLPGTGTGSFSGGDLESELRSKLVAHRIDLLYLAFCLAFVGLALGLRPTLPARFPRAR